MWPFLKGKDLGRGKALEAWGFSHPAGGQPGGNPPGVNYERNNPKLLIADERNMKKAKHGDNQSCYRLQTAKERIRQAKAREVERLALDAQQPSAWHQLQIS
jgi:hypothetical protein